MMGIILEAQIQDWKQIKSQEISALLQGKLLFSQIFLPQNKDYGQTHSPKWDYRIFCWDYRILLDILYRICRISRRNLRKYLKLLIIMTDDENSKIICTPKQSYLNSCNRTRRNLQHLNLQKPPALELVETSSTRTCRNLQHF